MLYSSKRALLLLAGLPAVLSFGTAPFMDKSDGDDLAVEASRAVKLAVLKFPDTICQNIATDDVDVLNNPKVWCNTGKPTKEKCQNGNRIRLGPSELPGAKTLTVNGWATVFDICAWDPNFKNKGYGKCVMSEFSYHCLNTCPGVDKFPGPAATGEEDVHIQTECLSKTRESVSQFYKDGGKYYPKYLTKLPEACEQKLVRCCSTQTWVTPWDDKICGQQSGTFKDGCCSNEDCPSGDRGRRMEEDLEDDVTKLKPRVGRRLSEVCPKGTTMYEMDNGDVCCEGKAVLWPDKEWKQLNPSQSGYSRKDPTKDNRQYEILEECAYKGGNTCFCEQKEKKAAGEASKCPVAKPTLWGINGIGR